MCCLLFHFPLYQTLSIHVWLKINAFKKGGKKFHSTLVISQSSFCALYNTFFSCSFISSTSHTDNIVPPYRSYSHDDNFTLLPLLLPTCVLFYNFQLFDVNVCLSWFLCWLIWSNGICCEIRLGRGRSGFYCTLRCYL